MDQNTAHHSDNQEPTPNGDGSFGSSSTQGGSQGSQQSQYNIPEETKTRFPKLVRLILETESMKDEERNYWFQSLPIMSDEQIKTLYGILITEKQKLQQIEQEYQDDLAAIAQEGIEEWNEFETEQKQEHTREDLKTKEAIDRAEDKQEQEDLLKELEEL